MLCLKVINMKDLISMAESERIEEDLDLCFDNDTGRCTECPNLSKCNIINC